MRLVSFDELRPKLNLEELDVELLAEAFKLLDCGHHYLWLQYDEMEKKAAEYAVSQGWDPDTTLVLYSPPASQEVREEPKVLIEPIEDFDIQIGHVDPNQVTCSLYQNLSVEKLADTLNKVARLKAFL